MHDANLQKGSTIPKTPWLAIITGCVSAVAGSLPFGPLFLLVPAILVFGAVLKRWSPRPGRWLMWLGAFYLTVDVAVFLGPPVFRPSHFIGSDTLIIEFLSILAIALVVWCDVSLIISARKLGNAPAAGNEKALRPADWIAAVFAVCLTAWTVWSALASSYPARRYHRWDISLLALPFILGAAVFDAALVVYALQIYRTRLRQSAQAE